ncbi:MAG: hypothetical protein DRH24_18840 [Deltaproteobacteria bacterium]|nr:MAG: hypothetical protein DRH24_18840 [Deltaproteobacteria bacterium]
MFKKISAILILLMLLYPVFVDHALAISLGSQAIRQEFVWNGTTFQTVNLYTIGNVDDYIGERCEVVHYGAEGSGSPVGSAVDYVYWDVANNQWATKYHCGAYASEPIQRWGGKDVTNEATVIRYDNLYYGLKDNNIYNVPISFEAVFEIILANGWKLTIEQHYDEWGHEVKFTAPGGEVSYVYGDPHLLQKGGTQQQELAAVGEYVFALGDSMSADYIVTFFCMKSNAGFSLVTDIQLMGPNDYELTIGRNGEFKRTGGSGPIGGGPDRVYYHTAPVDGITLDANFVYIQVEANGGLTGATLNWNGNNYPMTGSGRSWGITLNNLDDGTYTYYVTGIGSSYLTSQRTVTIQQASPAAIPTLSEWGMIILFLFLAGIAIFVLRHSNPGTKAI